MPDSCPWETGRETFNKVYKICENIEGRYYSEDRIIFSYTEKQFGLLHENILLLNNLFSRPKFFANTCRGMLVKKSAWSTIWTYSWRGCANKMKGGRAVQDYSKE